SYSLSSGDIEEGCYRISVKRETAPDHSTDASADEQVCDGLASNFLLDHVEEGHQVFVKGPLGQFFLPPNSTDPIALISMGIGITPLYSILEHAVNQKLDNTIYFIHGTKNSSTQLFREKLAQLKLGTHPNITMHIAHSQANKVYQDPEDYQENPESYQQNPEDYQIEGRLKPQNIMDIVKTPSVQFYLCGTHAFMETMYEGLLKWGVDEKNIHYEYFVKSKPLGRQAQNDVAHEVHFTRSNMKAIWSPTSGSLLDLAEENGISVPFGCRYGVCEACSVKLTKGAVEEDENIAELNTRDAILLCSTRPSSDLELDL
ncbi:MAG: iron-sulfur cluster-binding domain-containing protein, partial [Pseudomonadales bacterium]|nr:iron-sulfur cluster-binding domain-containing protein [Pseudomonadales bacterium]